MNDRVKIGANNPPPAEAWALKAEELMELVSDTTAGTAITTDEQEAALDDLLDQARKERKAADADRVAEKKPHDEAAKAVQSAYKPTLERFDAISGAIKALLTPYRAEKQRINDEAARKAREEAEAKERAAQEALKASDDLESKFKAEQEFETAKKLKAVANKIDRAPTGLRTYYEAEITDHKAAILHFMKRSPERFTALVQQMANEEARGSRGKIAGIVYHERKAAA